MQKNLNQVITESPCSREERIIFVQVFNKTIFCRVTVVSPCVCVLILLHLLK